MRAFPFLLVLAVALPGGFAYWQLRTTQAPASHDRFQGYVDAHLLQVGSERGGRVVELKVEEGDTVRQGQLVARLDDALSKARVAEAAAKLAEAKARLELALAPRKRPKELKVLQAALREAEAALEVSKKEFERIRRLVARGAEPPARLDAAKGAYERDLARVKAARERLEVARLPAREEEIALARAAVKAAEAALESARRDLARTRITAPAAGRVQEVLFRPGEVVGAGRPVILLLTHERLRVVFFVPQAVRPMLRLGQPVALACDGCPANLRGRIVYLGQQVEYTPPVLFSPAFRDKLVFRIEAAPQDEARRFLALGQPVDVRVLGEEGEKRP